VVKNSLLSSCSKKFDTKLEISSSFLVTTQKQRKKALKILIQLVQIILNAEKRFLAELPKTLLDSPQCDIAEQAVDSLCQAIDILQDAYS